MQLNRILKAICLLGVFLAVPGAALAADPSFPQRRLTLIVPWPAGGATDISMRVLAELTAKQLEQVVVVENRPGAAGTLVAPALKSSGPDGYTLGQLPMTLYRFPHQQKVAWNPIEDIAPVILISGYTFGILVPAGSPFRSLQDMIAWAKNNPGKMSVGSTGIGTTPHLAMEEVLGQHGIDYIHVPYKGTADQMIAIVSQALMAGVNSTGFAPHVESGKMRLLAVFSERRSPRWPQVPTVKELGYPTAVHNSPYGIGVARGTDARIVTRLHDALKVAMHDPQHVNEIAKYDQELSYMNSADYDRLVRSTWVREKAFIERLQRAPGAVVQ